MTQSFLLRNTRHYMSLSFIMLSHLTNGIHEICLHPCIYTLKKKEIQEIQKLIPPPWPDLRDKNSQDLFIGGDSRRKSTTMAPGQASISLDSSSHTFKVARPTPLTMTIPKYHSKNKTTTSDQTDSCKTPQKEKATFFHFGVLRKRFRLLGERQFTSTPDR